MFRSREETRKSEKAPSNVDIPSTPSLAALLQASTSPAAVLGSTGPRTKGGSSDPTGGQHLTTIKASTTRQSASLAPTNARNCRQRRTAPEILAAEADGTCRTSKEATKSNGPSLSGRSHGGRSDTTSARNLAAGIPTTPDEVATYVADDPKAVTRAAERTRGDAERPWGRGVREPIAGTSNAAEARAGAREASRWTGCGE